MPSKTADTSGAFDDVMYIGFGAASLADPASTARNATTAWIETQAGTVGGAYHGKSFNNIYNYRVALSFDLSGNDNDGATISGNTVQSATITFVSTANLTGFSTITHQTDEYVHLCKMSSVSTFDTTANINALDGWVSDGSYDGQVTEYADEISQAASSTLTFTLNSTAITDINSLIGSGGRLNVMMLSSDDFTDNVGTDGLGDPEGVSAFFTGEGQRLYMTEDATAGNHPKLNLTYAAAASGYGHDVMGVASANIGKINGVATADIGKVIGVD